MAVNENIRISKVLKEFNIGMGTLMEFLQNKGITVDANPNAKLSAEAYSLTEAEFRKEQIVKEESKIVAIKVKDITETEKQVEEEAPREIFIKTTIEEKRPKIVGKIDLNSRNKTAVNSAPEKAEAKPSPVP